MKKRQEGQESAQMRNRVVNFNPLLTGDSRFGVLVEREVKRERSTFSGVIGWNYAWRVTDVVGLKQAVGEAS